MLDLEIIPERSLRCENNWEFILGKNKSFSSISSVSFNLVVNNRIANKIYSKNYQLKMEK